MQPGPADFTQVIVDTTVQEKAISFPTDARLMHRARERLVRLARARGIKLRQSYARVGKFALIKHRRCGLQLQAPVPLDQHFVRLVQRNHLPKPSAVGNTSARMIGVLHGRLANSDGLVLLRVATSSSVAMPSAFRLKQRSREDRVQ